MHVFGVCVVFFSSLDTYVFFSCCVEKGGFFVVVSNSIDCCMMVNVVSWPRLYLLNDIILSLWNDFNLSTTNKPHFRGWYLMPFVFFYSFFHMFLEIRHMPFPNFHVHQIFLWNINAWLFYSILINPFSPPILKKVFCVIFLLYSSFLFLPKIPWIMYVDFVSFEIE